jgi:hypothetical protein
VAQIVLKGCGIHLRAHTREARPVTEPTQGSLPSRSVSRA